MIIVSIIGAITGIVGLVISLYGVLNNRFKVVSDYYSIDRDIKFIEARKKVYNLKENEISEDPDIAFVISYFHYWGLMVKKHYLPFYVFKSASGPAIIKMYDSLKPTILERRKINPYYAEYFEWLYKKVKIYMLKHSTKINV